MLTCWLLVKHFEYEIVGASLANNITAILTFAGQVVYVTYQKEIKQAWYWPTRRTFNNLWAFMKLALPGALMLIIENLNMEILVLLAGMLQSVEMLAA